jgi:hypothetical protein
MIPTMPFGVPIQPFTWPQLPGLLLGQAGASPLLPLLPLLPSGGSLPPPRRRLIGLCGSLRSGTAWSLRQSVNPSNIPPEKRTPALDKKRTSLNSAAGCASLPYL